MTVAVGDKFMAFLPHQCERPGGDALVSPSTMNPGFLTPTKAARHDPLQAIINDRVLGTRGLDKLRFALVDLTGDKLANPEFAGHREIEQGGVGSMAKLVCMLAAYQLPFDLQHFLNLQNSPPDEKRFFAGMREFWRFSQEPTKSVTTIFRSNPKIELVGGVVGGQIRVNGQLIPIPRPYSSPDLEQMFTISNGLVRFKGSDQTDVDASVPRPVLTVSSPARAYRNSFEHGNLTEARKLTFADRLFLMIDASDNQCSHTCLENVSFLYTTSVLWQSDIYRPERGGGLWEGANHEDKKGKDRFEWARPPVPPEADHISGTPASIAAIYTLMEQDRLVSKNACISMRQLTNRFKSDIRGGSFNRSFFQDGLRRAAIFPQRLHGKIGIGDAHDDSALIVRDVDPTENARARDARVRDGTRIRYVAVVCDDRRGVDLLHDIIVKLDTCIRQNNGLMTDHDA